MTYREAEALKQTLERAEPQHGFHIFKIEPGHYYVECTETGERYSDPLRPARWGVQTYE